MLSDVAIIDYRGAILLRNIKKWAATHWWIPDPV